ncbi:MAG: flagellin [Polaromonas sp.]|nr:flagellin [Polaromonas sp.]
MSVINTNVKALYTQAAMKTTDRASSIAMQQLSTGKRINSAKDDAAGLAISTRMTQQIRSLNQAMRNAGDAVSLIQTAEGATSQITNMLQRMRELSIQAINDTNATDQRGYLDLEFQQLKQEIVRIADTTEWNGFPILNGTTGERVGERPVYKATSAGTSTDGLTYAAGTVTKVGHAGTIASMVGTLAKAGTVSIVGDSATAATATLTLTDGSKTTIPGVVVAGPPSTITFTNSALTGGAGTGTFVITSDAAFIKDQVLSFTVSRAFTPVAAMASNDVQINGVTIGASYAADDKFSPAASAAASAIARAAAINLATAATGVSAVVNANVMSGSAMVITSVTATGTVTINGFTSASITTAANNTRESRAAVVSAINAISAQTGVVAIDNINDTQGIRLEAANGRNIEVAFNSLGSSSADFAARTGLREGLQVGTYSLETSVEKPLKVTSVSTGDWTRVGLKPADYSVNQAVINTGVRPAVTDAALIKTLGVGDLSINGVAIRATTPNDDKFSSTTSLTSSKSASAIAIAAAINESRALTGVTAKANSVSTSGTTTVVHAALNGTQSLIVNGVNVQVVFSSTETAAERRTKVIEAVNLSFGQHGVMASESGTGGVTLTTPDGRNLSVAYNTTVSNLIASGFGLGIGTADTAGVKGAGGVDATYTGAPTLYGSVSLTADAAPKQPPAGAAPSNGAPPPYVSKTFTVEAGVNGFSTEGDFKSLGFQAGTFGGDVNEATSKMTPPRTGRMSFHVGASANQTITIDLADFGKGGPITGAITGDSGKTPADVHISTGIAAKSVLALLDVAMDKLNGARGTMGAVMNRLEHVIDNLSNVVINTEASRSLILDADYASASSELSRTQIMKQAATAVLAQANTDQQTVLKLLQ